MSSGNSKPPAAPDPAMIIGLQNKYNRYNTHNPFGSASWADDGSGHETLTQAPSDQMQGAIDRAFQYSATPNQQEHIPQGMSQLASAIMGRVGARYGLGTADPNNHTIGATGGAYGDPHGGALDTSMTSQKPQGQSAPPPQMGGMQTRQMGNNPMMGG